MSKFNNERPLITYQTGENESFLIGTKEQLLSLAQSIVEAVNTAVPEDFFGHETLVSKALAGKLDAKAEIQIDEVVVVNSTQQKDEIFYAINNS